MLNRKYDNLLHKTTNFDAILRTEDGKIYETGYGCVSAENKSVDFLSDFVPLMDLHSPVEIVKVVNGEECHSFTGEVYLSAPTRMQISNVSDKLLSLAELCIPVKTSFLGTAFTIVTLPPTRFKKEGKEIVESCCIEIFSISINEVYFTAPNDFPRNTQMLLTIKDALRLDDIEVEIYRQLDFSQDKIAFYATIKDISVGAKKALTDYLVSKLLIF